METTAEYQMEAGAPEAALDDLPIDEFVHQRTEVLETKLRILAIEILERFDVHGKNVERMDVDEQWTRTSLYDVLKKIRYNLARSEEKAAFYKGIQDLHKERRLEDVECWRDVVGVMKDFLVAWEAHEHAKARGRFLRGI